MSDTVLLFAQLNERFALLRPQRIVGNLDQNSFIFVSRLRFNVLTWQDVTDLVLEHLGGTFLAPGDLFVVTIRDTDGVPWLLATFHGDSNGLSTQPAMIALREIAQTKFADHVLLAGIDANTRSLVKSFLHK